MSLAVSNGILTSYGQQTDSKGPETITALAGLLQQATATAGKAGLVAQGGTVTGAQEAPILQGAIADFQSAINSNGLPSEQKNPTGVKKVVDKANGAYNILMNPTITDDSTAVVALKAVVKDVALLKFDIPGGSTADQNTVKYNSAVETLERRYKRLSTICRINLMRQRVEASASSSTRSNKILLVFISIRFRSVRSRSK